MTDPAPDLIVRPPVRDNPCPKCSGHRILVTYDRSTILKGLRKEACDACGGTGTKPKEPTS